DLANANWASWRQSRENVQGTASIPHGWEAEQGRVSDALTIATERREDYRPRESCGSPYPPAVGVCMVIASPVSSTVASQPASVSRSFRNIGTARCRN